MYMYNYRPTCTSVFMHVCTHACIFICRYLRTSYVFKCRLYICLYAHVQLYMRVSLCACMYIILCEYSMYACTMYGMYYKKFIYVCIYIGSRTLPPGHYPPA